MVYLPIYLSSLSSLDNALEQSLLNSSMPQNYLDGLLKFQVLGGHLRVQVYLGCDLSICISKKFPGDLDATGLETHLDKLPSILQTQV